jgi:glutamate N-acetyltransferase/amino-acid N-acetyltransferase
MRARRARVSDAASIHALITHYSEQGLLLERSEEEIRRNIGHFLVQTNGRHVVGCLSLEKYSAELAEIRSVAVDPEARGCGIGAKLIAFALEEAADRDRACFRRHARAAVLRAPGICRLAKKVADGKNRARLLHLCETPVLQTRCGDRDRAARAHPVANPRRVHEAYFRRMKSRPLPADVPRGFTFAATACGLKRKGLDLALLTSETPATAAAVFTTNRVQAAPVRLSQKHLQKSRHKIRGVIVNSGNANCCTGSQGIAASSKTAAEISRSLGCKPREILICSTGVIGVPLRVEKIIRAIPHIAQARSSTAGAFEQFTRAIMTTDTRPKWAAAKCRVGGKQVRILGCAKGSGMIEPNMATMLGFLATDAALSPALLSKALRAVVAQTFNAITVDGDTSTNDTVTLFANGESGARKIKSENGDYQKFCAALEIVCRSLALAIVADGEGAQRVIGIQVLGAASHRSADKIARTIANSPLVKTAFAGADPNWGRILAAAGRSGISFEPSRVDIQLAGIRVCRRGRERPFNERVAHRRMLAKYVSVIVNLRSGCGTARVWTCDFTAEYVRINASYRS